MAFKVKYVWGMGLEEKYWRKKKKCKKREEKKKIGG